MASHMDFELDRSDVSNCENALLRRFSTIADLQDVFARNDYVEPG